MSDIWSLFDKIKKTEKVSGPPEYIIVGLGNPGKDYEKTRHNTGFMAMDLISDKLSCHIDRLKFKALTTTAELCGHNVLLMKPQTFMNLSGEAVFAAMDFYKIPLDKVIVVFDDTTLDVGKMRIRKKGSAGGHNGLTNINELIGTQDYARIRVGIGNEFGRGQQVDYVLGKLNEEEMEQMKEISKRVIDGVKAWATVGADRAMNVVNTKPKPKEIEAEK